jgi:hypothetical protein
MFNVISVISTSTYHLYSYIATIERVQLRLWFEDSGWLSEEKQCHHWSTHIPRSLFVLNPVQTTQTECAADEFWLTGIAGHQFDG